MNQIEDERIKFYFEHEAQITEWAQIEKDAVTFSHDFYLTIKAPLDKALREHFPGDVESFVGSNAKWPSIGLRKRDDWPTADSDPDVRLEWMRRDCLLTMDECRWVGIRTNVEQYHHALTEERIEEYPDRSSWWPVYTYLSPAPDGFWEGDGLEEYRAYLVASLVKAWRVLSPLVDKAVDHRR